jgi:hypothetical protein
MNLVRIAGALMLLSGTMLAGPMTARERQRLVSHLEMTESWLVDEIASLSKEQLEFRSEPSTWSVKDTVEHLAVAEAQYWQEIQDSMKQAVVTDKDSTDEDLRGHRYKDSKTDAYQWFTMISSHSQRHILQAPEIKHHANFPKK